ncbi:HPr(Ser) kinase/phosphatase [Coraliomargarita akajimensis]|uniref:HPr kinase/phosphorylase n=1 Tax=Coraliomargarita akajimensis (strain DSM 45221 / IAM 15411 / JCM 23193 / KCTC 12865 / 04OKA010-24) TaxID=583355 RepID=D5EIM8_CORAD|nr:HPr(Ser) kinase/phosphatase [Coraliomargarita akajimensis]ADE56149.1 HPr kinase [Coraliomargarita akajimensis DSM 45221]
MTKKARANMTVVESVPVREFFDSFKEPLELELVAGEGGLDRMIGERSLNRPALALTGYFKYFAAKRMQLFGAGEMAFLRDLKEKEQREIITEILERKVPCILISRNLLPTKIMKALADEYKTPLIRSSLKSKTLTTEATLLLEEKFAPRTHIHGTLLDVRGIGTLICGESGVGKSECALALIERGHSLVADDLTYVKRLSDRDLMGSSSELSRGYMECRGLGILNIADLFGVRSVRLEKRIDLVINFVAWSAGMHEERTGLEENRMEILGMQVPLMEIPVRPGRDMARLVEVAAMVHALKVMGHDSAAEFNEKLIAHMMSGNS